MFSYFILLSPFSIIFNLLLKNCKNRKKKLGQKNKTLRIFWNRKNWMQNTKQDIILNKTYDNLIQFTVAPLVWVPWVPSEPLNCENGVLELFKCAFIQKKNLSNLSIVSFCSFWNPSIWISSRATVKYTASLQKYNADT